MVSHRNIVRVVELHPSVKDIKKLILCVEDAVE